MDSNIKETRHSKTSLRDNIIGGLAVAFFASVLLCKVSSLPKSWRRIDASMTKEQIRLKLGEPDTEAGDALCWYDNRLVGTCELVIAFKGENQNVTALHREFRWFWKGDCHYRPE